LGDDITIPYLHPRSWWKLGSWTFSFHFEQKYSWIKL